MRIIFIEFFSHVNGYCLKGISSRMDRSNLIETEQSTGISARALDHNIRKAPSLTAHRRHKFLTPMFLGARLQLNVVAVFLTVIFWTWLWSIPGALMAVPILVLMKLICDNVPDLAVFGNFHGGRAIEPVAPGRPVEASAPVKK